MELLQHKMLEGGRTAKESALTQEAKLKDAADQILEHKRKQMELLREKESAEEAKLLLEENYSSIKEEVAAKTKKLKLLQKKLLDVQAELKDAQSEFEVDREGTGERSEDICM